MKIILKRLTLTNFKGVKKQIIDFDSKSTSIFGANEAGKTTVFDAFSWLLFGKDSFDRKDFNIKNTKFPELNRQEHQVEAMLLIDGEENTLIRVYKEKWTKKKGQTISELTGNEQEFYWNGVPMQAGEFAKKVSSLVDEMVFKLITNPHYFNSLNWSKRREFLFKLAGEISDSEIAAQNPDFEILLETLKTKSLIEYKKEISAKKKNIKDVLEAIPHRIDEVSKSLPEEQDWRTIEVDVKAYQNSLADYDTLINDASKANKAYLDEVSEKQNQLHNAKSKIRTIEFNAESDFTSKKNQLSRAYSNDLSALENAVEDVKRNLNSKSILSKTLSEKNDGLMLRKNSLLEMFNSVNEKELEFKDNEFCCPTCKRDFDANDIEAKKTELLQNFMTDKNKALDEIEAKGLALKKEIEENDDLVKKLNQSIIELEQKLVYAENSLEKFKAENKAPEYKIFNLVDVLSDNEEYKNLQLKVENLTKELEQPKPEDKDNTNLINLKKEVIEKLDAAKKLLNSKEALENGKIRIEELKSQEIDLSQQLANLEGLEFTIDAFNKAKIEAVEARINDKFQYVTFKMYNFTIEGNPVETCETMYKGVPFSDLNTAGKIWAGLDIINTLSNHYNVFAPVFLDNRESVTSIPFTESQVVNLFVSPEDKELRVA